MCCEIQEKLLSPQFFKKNFVYGTYTDHSPLLIKGNSRNGSLENNSHVTCEEKLG